MVFGVTGLPKIAFLAFGIAMLFVGYILGEVVQMLEDGLLLLAIRVVGFLAVVYYFMRILFNVDPL